MLLGSIFVAVFGTPKSVVKGIIIPLILQGKKKARNNPEI